MPTMRSDAATVEEYLEELPEGRRRAIETVRRAILAHLPEGYEEAVNWGMISYQVPLERYPHTYNGRPLLYAALASLKNHMAVYLNAVYADEEARRTFEKEYRASGKPMDMGKSCVRFESLDDLPLDLIEDAVASVGVDEFIALQEEARSRRSR